MPAPTPPFPRVPRPEALAETIIKTYENATDELLVNLAKHFDVTDISAGTYSWQIRKLAEMGQLTRENIEILAKLTGKNPKELQAEITAAAQMSLDQIEPKLAEAVKKGLLSAPATTPLTSPRIVKLMQEYQMQSVDKLNLVNTVMLNSSLEAYKTGVTNTVFYRAQMDAAQQILNEQTGAVVLGTKSYTSATRKAISQMIDSGLTGFIDRAGHNWTPEAYVSMDIGTTMHNTYVRSAFNRNEDYGNDLVYPGIKATSRPLCYPWQGKVLSTANRSGYVTDLSGNEVRIYAISETTYGEPAGIWGINCGHSCNVFVPGLSTVRGDVPEKDGNDERYSESQQQRYLERQVRYAKRDAAVAKASKDTETFEKSAQRVKQRNAALDSFLSETGRAASPSRTSVVGYDRSVAASVRFSKGGKNGS